MLLLCCHNSGCVTTFTGLQSISFRYSSSCSAAGTGWCWWEKQHGTSQQSANDGFHVRTISVMGGCWSALCLISAAGRGRCVRISVHYAASSCRAGKYTSGLSRKLYCCATCSWRYDVKCTRFCLPKRWRTELKSSVSWSVSGSVKNQRKQL